VGLVDREADVLTQEIGRSVCSIALFSVCRCEELVFRSIYSDLRLGFKVATHPKLVRGANLVLSWPLKMRAGKGSFCFGDLE